MKREVKMELVFDGGSDLEEKNNFVEYLLMFYAEDPKYDAVYPEVAMTREDAIKHTVEYLEGDFPCVEDNWVENEFGVKVPTHLWGGGDTIDREKVCELFLNAKEVA